MRLRAAAAPAAFTLAILGVACGHPEKSVIDQYFNAIRAGDTQTLASFATFTFEKKPEKWAIKSTLDEQKVAAPLPDLVKKLADADKAVADNKRQAQLYSNDNYVLIEQVKEAQKKNATLSAKLQPVAAAWTKFNETDRELKKAAAQAKEATERERRSVLRSVGQIDDADVITGEMIEKKVELDLTLDGQTQPYVMVLKKYALKRDTGPKVGSRWVITSLQPKS